MQFWGSFPPSPILITWNVVVERSALEVGRTSARARSLSELWWSSGVFICCVAAELLTSLVMNVSGIYLFANHFYRKFYN